MTLAAVVFIVALAALVVGMWTWQIRHVIRTAPAAAAIGVRWRVRDRADAADLDALRAHLALEAMHQARRTCGAHLTVAEISAAAADPQGAAARFRREGTPDAYAAARDLEDLARQADREAITAVITWALEEEGRSKSRKARG